MKNKILIVCSVLLVASVLTFVYLTIRGHFCFDALPFYSCSKSEVTGGVNQEFTKLSDWLVRLEGHIPDIMTVDKNQGRFTFNHKVNFTSPVWTTIIRDGHTASALGFYTDYTEPLFYLDPEITPLTENTVIASVWAQPRDTKLYNGPFTNYLVDFFTGKVKKLETKGLLAGKSKGGNRVVFLESECDKNPGSLAKGADCNGRNLSLRLVDLSAGGKDDFTLDGFEDAKFAQFNNLAFSPSGEGLAFEARYPSVDYDQEHYYWRLFVADTSTGKIIRADNTLREEPYRRIFWLDDESVIHW